MKKKKTIVPSQTDARIEENEKAEKVVEISSAWKNIIKSNRSEKKSDPTQEESGFKLDFGEEDN